MFSWKSMSKWLFPASAQATDREYISALQGTLHRRDPTCHTCSIFVSETRFSVVYLKESSAWHASSQKSTMQWTELMSNLNYNVTHVTRGADLSCKCYDVLRMHATSRSFPSATEQPYHQACQTKISCWCCTKSVHFFVSWCCHLLCQAFAPSVYSDRNMKIVIEVCLKEEMPHGKITLFWLRFMV
jgi:hypothetical protein